MTNRPVTNMGIANDASTLSPCSCTNPVKSHSNHTRTCNKLRAVYRYT